MSELEHTETVTSNEIMSYSLITRERCRNSEAPQQQMTKPRTDIKSQEMQEVELKQQQTLRDMRERHNALSKESQDFMWSLDEFKSSIEASLKRKARLKSNNRCQQQQNLQSMDAQRDLINHPQLTSANNAD